MKLTFRKREVKNLSHLETLVAENSEAIEPGLQILTSNLNLGRTSVELAGVDAAHTPVLISLGLTADDAMLVRALEAYAWCLEYPESVQRFVPATVQAGWPPRVVFVAERLLESFVRKMRLLRFSEVDCFEFRYVEVNGTTGFYLDRVDWVRASSASPGTVAAPPEAMARPVAPRDEPKTPDSIVGPAMNSAGCLETVEGSRERSQALLDGLRAAAERPRAPQWLELLRAPEVPADGEAEPAPREDVTAVEPAPPPAARVSSAETTPEPAPDPRTVLPGLELPSNRDLAPTWRKFLDRLTGTFDTRPAPQPEEPPVGAAAEPGDPITVQPLAAPIQPASRNGNGRPAEETADKPPTILTGLTLPSNGELAPQWRRFLDRPSIADSKIAVVCAYLQREFPLCTVYDFHEFQRNAQVFQLQDNHGKVAQLITMTAEFFEAHKDLEIRAWIEKHRLAQAMRQAGQAGVLVTNAGLQVEKR